MAWRNKLSVGELTVDAITGGGGFLNEFPGKKVYIDPVNGTDGNPGTSPGNARKSFAAGKALLTPNKNDCLVMIGGASTFGTTAALTWATTAGTALSYTHLIGVVAGGGFRTRNRVYTATADVATLFTSAANGCIFQDVLFTQEGADVHNIGAFKLTGGRNVFKRCIFTVTGALGCVATGKRDFVLNSSDGENYFEDCVFGADTYDGSADAANYNFEFNGAVETARNKFKECFFIGSGSAGACWILCTTVSALSSFQYFDKCTFYNNAHGTMNVMTQGFNLNGASGGEFIMREPEIYGCTNLETVDSGMLIVSNVNAAATSGKMLAATW